jgi:sugar phosphate isomerase/epimerase
VSIDPDRLGIQLYSLLSEIEADDETRRQANLHRVLATLAGLGYRTFENFGGTWGWTPAEYREAFESHGLRAVGDHGELDPTTFDERLDQAQALGLRYVGSSGWPEPGFDTVERALETAATLNELGERAARRGLMVYGHNHAPELSTRLSFRGRELPALEVLLDNTDPALVTFELDVHWAWVGLGLGRFGDLLALLRRHSPRIALLHVKGTAAGGDIADVGGPDDLTDWRAVFRAAADVDLYLYEYDFPPDPTASAAAALAFLSEFKF